MARNLTDRRLCGLSMIARVLLWLKRWRLPAKRFDELVVNLVETAIITTEWGSKLD
jgi:hypothetical protein